MTVINGGTTMIVYEDECVGCPPEIGCFGNSCPKRNAPHYYCDECGAEDTLRHHDGEHLCADCLLGRFPIVEGSDY